MGQLTNKNKEEAKRKIKNSSEEAKTNYENNYFSFLRDNGFFVNLEGNDCLIRNYHIVSRFNKRNEEEFVISVHCDKHYEGEVDDEYKWVFTENTIFNGAGIQIEKRNARLLRGYKIERKVDSLKDFYTLIVKIYDREGIKEGFDKRYSRKLYNKIC